MPHEPRTILAVLASGLMGLVSACADEPPPDDARAQQVAFPFGDVDRSASPIEGGTGSADPGSEGCFHAPPLQADLAWTDLVAGESTTLDGDALRIQATALNADVIVSYRLLLDADGQAVEYETSAVELAADSTHVWSISLAGLGVELETLDFSLGIQAIADVEMDGHVRQMRLPYIYAHEASDGAVLLYDEHAMLEQHAAGNVKGIASPPEAGPDGMGEFVLARVGAAHVEVVTEESDGGSDGGSE